MESHPPPPESSPAFRPLPWWIDPVIDSRTVSIAILLNSVVLFILGFEHLSPRLHSPLVWVDYGCTVFFLLEMGLKIRKRTWGTYWSSPWNRVDFVVVLLSSPSLLSPFFDTADFSVILMVRMARLFRMLKIANFIPDYQTLLHGVRRALSASVGVVVTLFIYVFILAMFSTTLFGDLVPEGFGDPLMAMYSIFRIFTLEGWTEYPELIAQRGGPLLALMARTFFSFVVLSGGIIGLSIANAIFVDEMVMDNTQKVEDHLKLKLDALHDERMAQNKAILSELQSLRLEVQRLSQ